MFWRLSGVVVCAAALGAWVLTLRHNRVQAQSELTQAQLRINRQDEKLWHLRTSIAGRITPPEVERLCAGLGPLRPIMPYAPAAAWPTVALVSGPESVPFPPAPVPPVGPTISPTGRGAKSTPAKGSPASGAPKAGPTGKPAKPAAKPPIKKDAAKPPAAAPTRIATKKNPQG